MSDALRMDYEGDDTMTTTPRDRIASLLRQANALTVYEVAQITNISAQDAQDILREMDEAGDAFMRNGFYRASEVLKAAKDYGQ